MLQYLHVCAFLHGCFFQKGICPQICLSLALISGLMHKAVIRLFQWLTEKWIDILFSFFQHGQNSRTLWAIFLCWKGSYFSWIWKWGKITGCEIWDAPYYVSCTKPLMLHYYPTFCMSKIARICQYIWKFSFVLFEQNNKLPSNSLT